MGEGREAVSWGAQGTIKAILIVIKYFRNIMLMAACYSSMWMNINC